MIQDTIRIQKFLIQKGLLMTMLTMLIRTTRLEMAPGYVQVLFIFTTYFYITTVTNLEYSGLKLQFDG